MRVCALEDLLSRPFHRRAVVTFPLPRNHVRATKQYSKRDLSTKEKKGQFETVRENYYLPKEAVLEVGLFAAAT